MSEPRMIPFLWFTSPMREVLDYYRSIFSSDFEQIGGEDYNDEVHGPVQITTVKIMGTPLRLMSAQEHDTFNDSISFQIACRDQAEIDRLWSAITAEGRESQCGWCVDKFGVRWQILPENMAELLSMPGAMERMFTMTKLSIAVLAGSPT